MSASQKVKPTNLLLGLLSLSLPVNAATMSASCTVTNSLTLTHTAPTTTGNAVCPQFNPALGNLTSAVYLFTPNAFSGVDVQLQNTTGALLNVSGQVPVTFGSTIGPFPGAAAVASSFPAPLFVNGTIASGATQSFSPTGAGHPAGLQVTTGLSALVGTGTYQIPLQLISDNQRAQPAGVVLVSYSLPLTIGQSEIIYAYDAIPEPATMGIGLAGLVAAITLGRRRG